MKAQNETVRPSTRQLLRRALMLSLVFPVAGWFFASWIGLAVSGLAVGAWWVLRRPVQVFWAVAVACLVAAPFALWVQGLPQRSVAGPDIVTRHWLANDLVLAGLVLAALAAMTELLGLDFDRPRPKRSFRFGARILERARQRFEPEAPVRRESRVEDAPDGGQERLDLGEDPGSHTDGLLPST